ncbi:MAG: PEP-CTERM sorting domain-containing protein [Cyanobacteria bacterium J06628_6]
MALACKTATYTCIALVGGAAAVLVAIPAGAETSFDFSGDYAPDQWAVRSFNASGSFSFNDIDLDTGAAQSLTITGSDLGGTDNPGCSSSPLPDDCTSGYLALVVQVDTPSVIEFDWEYITEDLYGDEACDVILNYLCDPFGYVVPEYNDQGELIAGKFESLTPAGMGVTQEGSASIKVLENEFFAFQLGTLDNQFGPAQVTITEFSVKQLEPDIPTPVDPPPVDPPPVEPPPVEPPPVEPLPVEPPPVEPPPVDPPPVDPPPVEPPPVEPPPVEPPPPPVDPPPVDPPPVEPPPVEPPPVIPPGEPSTSVPEPGVAIALFLSGLSLFGLRKRRS